MSTTYNYTRNPYTQIASWPGYTILPQDGDPFVALSANLYEKAVHDRNMYIFEGAVKNNNPNGAIRMDSDDGLTVTVYPFIIEVYDDTSGVYKTVRYDFNTVISAADLISPGTFDPDTWYPVYLWFKMDGSTQIVIDNTGNIQYYLLYRELVANIQDKAFKFLGSFLTDGTANIYPFFKDGTEVCFINPIRVLAAGQEVMPTAIPLAQYIPPYCRQVKLAAHLFNGSNMPNYFRVTSNLSPGLVINLAGDTTFKAFQHTAVFVYNMDSMQQIFYNFNISGANVSEADMDLIGYRE